MPVTIGTLTSNVTVNDGAAPLTDATMERLVRAAVARVKEELRAEEESRRDRTVPDRQSEANPF